MPGALKTVQNISYISDSIIAIYIYSILITLINLMPLQGRKSLWLQGLNNI